jgi:2-polyprenyl-6-methoxyphenol hydroxylase-like FAD-dependent oxidoreductase
LATELLGFQRNADSVTVCLKKCANDGSATEELVTAEYLVGADGGRSTVRRELGLAFEGETLPGRQIYGDVHIEGLDTEVGLILSPTQHCLVDHRLACSTGMPSEAQPTYSE